MQEWSAELAADCRAELGEGPVWDTRQNVLWWVDISGRRLHRFSPDSSQDEALAVANEVGAVVPRRGGGLLCAVREGFAVFGDDCKMDLVVRAHLDPGMRMNDAKCDSLGRLWASSMALEATPRAGSLYRLGTNFGLSRVLPELTIGNGLAWSADDRTMYFIDSATRAVDAFDFEANSGELSGRRQVISLPEGVGLPDGMCIDAEGCLWVALFGGSAVRRYTVDGELVGLVNLPVTNVTCPAFGGPGLTDLYVTTAREGLSQTALAAQPEAGGLFVVQPGVAGHAPYEFAG